MSTIKSKLNQAFQKKWVVEWQKSIECRQTRIFFPTPNPKQSKNLLVFGRKKLGQLVQLITGHNWLNYHQHKICQDIDPLCRLCKEDSETSWHLIGECPALMERRHEVFHNYFLDENPEWTVFQLRDMINGSRTLGIIDGLAEANP